MRYFSIRNFLLLLFFITTNFAIASIVIPITNYSTSIYNAGTQNWCILTHNNGWMYFANNNGLLEYDGNNWNIYKNDITNHVIRALDADYTNNIIYAGGDNEYGYFSPTDIGSLEYHSMSDNIPDSLKDLGQIWGIVSTEECLYVRSDNKLLKHEKNGVVKEIETRGYVYGIVKSGDAVFAESQNGLGIITGDRIIAVKDNGLLKDKVVRSICSFVNGSVLMATQNDGIYIYDGESVKPFHTDIDNILKDGDIFSITSNNSRIAFGFINKGVAVTDIIGKNVNWFSTKNGLDNNTILSMSFDKIGNLWLGLDNGIDLISFGSPIRYLYGKNEFLGAGYAACQYNGDLYIGTNQGVFISKDHGSNFSNVRGCTGQIWSLDIIDNNLLCCADNGIFVLEGKTLVPISTSTGYWRVRTINRTGNAIAGSYSGFVLLTKSNGKFSYKTLKGIDINPRVFEIDNKGNIILSINNKLLYGTIKNDSIGYTEIAQTKNGIWSIQKIDGTILVSSPDMVATVDKEGSLNTNSNLISKLHSTNNYSASIIDKKGNIWFTIGDTIFTRNSKNGKLYSFIDKAGLRVDGFESIYALSDNTVLVGSHKGFILPDTAIVMSYNHDNVINPIIRRIMLTNLEDSVVYGQSFTTYDKEIKIDYNYNSLRFIVSGTDISANSNIEFAYMLEPIENQYSKFTSSNSKEYTTLKKGTYTLHIKSKNSHSDNEGYSSIQFTINPPFYESWWAYLIYILTGLSILYMLYNVILNRIKQSKRKLEIKKDREILEYQRTLNEERLMKEKEILTLKNEQTEINLKLKTKELANVALSRITYNDTLTMIKADLKKVSTAIKNGEYNTALNKLITIQSTISESFDNDVDWNKFEDDFNVTHHNFITKLKEAYPNLTKKEIKLCVFIKMGLLTKEIAPLMNISVRGAEMLRFRMRKKLNADTDVNLANLFEKL